MSGLRDFAIGNAPAILAIGGLLIGSVFGAAVYHTNYCAMGGLSDIHNFNDYRRFRAWVLAAATALIGTQLAVSAGVVDVDRSMYLSPALNWFGHLAGGWLFGVGMVFAGGCPSRNLARAGGGDLRALLTLMVLGVVAYMTIGGLVAPLRSAIDQTVSISLGRIPTQGLGEIFTVLFGAARGSFNLALAVLIGGAALAFCFLDAKFRNSPVHIASGTMVGLTVVAGWIVTGLAYDEMASRPVAPISLTYVRPTGDTLQWLTLYTATPVPGFGVASVFGALIGAGAAAWWAGRFRLTTFSDTGDTLRNLGGAALMGVGGVMALGCTVGQAVTGASTLAIGSFLTFGAIIAGGFYGLKLLERWIAAD
jgi:uncharacterized membrane protein YedE/YeeE